MNIDPVAKNSNNVTIEISSQLLKNIINSLLTIQPEVNMIITNDPSKIQFVISKLEGYMHWSVDATVIPNDPNANIYKIITIMIDKLSKTITTESDYSCRLLTSENSIKLSQYTIIRNCLSDGNKISDISLGMELVVPYVINHPSITEYIYDYMRYKRKIVSDVKICAVFKHKLFEYMINSCLDVTREIVLTVENKMMSFKSEAIDDKLVISSPVLGDHNNSLSLVKRIEISSLNYIKTYRKISQLVSIEIVMSDNSYYMSVKPITAKPLDTELVLCFI